MDPGQRRRASPGSARLIARAAIAVGLLLLLGRLVAGPATQARDDAAHGGAVRVLTSAPGADECPEAPAPLEVAASFAPQAVVPAVPPNTIDERLAASIRRLIQGAKADAQRKVPSRVTDRNVHVGVHVRERGVPGDLVALDADRPMRPASNMKLVTSAAALVLLGPAWRFETPFELAGEVRGERLEGALVVRAAGDPAYDAGGAPGCLPLGYFDPLVRALEQAGVRALAGGVVLDEGSFVAPGPGPGWPSSNQFDQEYCALSGGFTIGAGCLTATVRPRRPGQAAEVSVGPWGHGLEEAFDVDTVAARQALVVHVQARGGRATVRGRMPVDVSAWTTRFAHEDPVELYGHVLCSRLRAASIAVEGGFRRVRGHPGGRELVRLTSPLAATLAPINTDSNNAVADQVYFATGDAVRGSGTRAGGRAATALALERLGVPVDGLVQVDGSGLSRENRVTARQITALVDAVLGLDRATADAFEASLAVGGETGTLADRMDAVAGRVRGKTGYIGGTSALSGTLTTKDGRELVFSILVEYPVVSGLNPTVWKPLQDKICAVLVGADG